MILTVSLGACTTATSDKPLFDPVELDTELLASEEGKADQLTRRYTTVTGDLVVGARSEYSIAYPDYAHGLTFEMTENQVLEFIVTSTAAAGVRLYGPAVGRNDRFRQAVFSDTVTRRQELAFDFEAEEAGTYMLVYVPYYVWRADYTVDVTCPVGCRREGECFDDAECASGEFCGDNGVRCIRAPCDVNFNVCQEQGGEGAHCLRDAMCSDGLHCNEESGRCEASDSDACETDDDCAEGFCRCADDSCRTRACAPWSEAGEGCGGFTLPTYQRRCAPGLDCMYRPYIADAPGICAMRATVEELVADPERFDGFYVGVQGELVTGLAICTRRACSPEEPCCNQCGAQQYFVDPGTTATPGSHNALTLEEAGTVYGCTGNECNYGESCTGVEGDYILFGRYSYGDFDFTLDIDQTWSAGLPGFL